MAKIWELTKDGVPLHEQDNAILSLIVNQIRQQAAIMEYAEFYQFQGDADRPEKTGSDGGGSTRALNAAFTGQTSAQSYLDIDLFIYGEAVKTDKALNRRGKKAQTKHRRDIERFAAGLGRHLQDHIINGDNGSSAEQFDGLQQKITGDQIISAPGDNGLVILNGNDNAAKKSQQQALEALYEAIEKIPNGAEWIMMDYLMLTRLSTVFSDNFKTERDQFGRLIRVFNDIPVIKAGYGKDGSTKVLPFTETAGTSENCGSIYCGRFGEEDNITLATNVGLDATPTANADNFVKTTFELDLDLGLIDDKAATRITGLRLEDVAAG